MTPLQRHLISIFSTRNVNVSQDNMKERPKIN